jgi:hypothetical protein
MTSPPKDFLSVYGPGKQSEKKFGWHFYSIVILAIVVGNLVEQWLAAHYSIPWFKRLPLSLSAGVLVAVLLAFVAHKAVRKTADRS